MREELTDLRKRNKFLEKQLKSKADVEVKIDTESEQSFRKELVEALKWSNEDLLSVLKDSSPQLLARLQRTMSGEGRELGHVVFAKIQEIVNAQAAKSGARTVRWPAVAIELFTRMYSRSSVDYHHLKNLGFCRMPTGRLLRQYTQRESRCVGVDVGRILERVQDLRHHLQRTESVYTFEEASWITFGLDEMSISPDLLISKTGRVHGLPIPFHVLKVHDKLSSREDNSSDLAPSIMSSISRCLGTSFSFPTGYFPLKKGVNAMMMYSMFVEVTTALLFAELLPIFAVWDGLSSNKKCAVDFIRHSCDATGQPFYLSQDLTHVFKRLCNRFFLSYKNVFAMYVDGTWHDVHVDHVKAAILQDVVADRSGMRMMPGLNVDDLYPSNLKKMRPSVGLKIVNDRVLIAMQEFVPEHKGTASYLRMVLRFWKFTKIVVSANAQQAFSNECKEIKNEWSVFISQASHDRMPFQPCLFDAAYDVIQSVKTIEDAVSRWIKAAQGVSVVPYLPISVFLQDDTERLHSWQRANTGSTNNPNEKQYAFNLDRAAMRQDGETSSYLDFRCRLDKNFSYKLPSFIEDVLEIDGRNSLMKASVNCMTRILEVFRDNRPSSVQVKVLERLIPHLAHSRSAMDELLRMYDTIQKACEQFEALYIFSTLVREKAHTDVTAQLVKECDKDVLTGSCEWRVYMACISIYFQCAFRAKVKAPTRSASVTSAVTSLNLNQNLGKHIGVLYYVAGSIVSRHISHCWRMMQFSKREEDATYWRERANWTVKHFVVDRSSTGNMPMAKFTLRKEEFGGFTYLSKDAAYLFVRIGTILE